MLNLSLIQNSDANNNNSSSNMIGRSGGVSRLSARSSQQLNMLVAKNHMNLSMGNPTAAANSSPSVMAAGNLSPSITVNVENGSPSTISINNALTIRHPLLTTPSVVVTPASSCSVEPPPPPLVATTVSQHQQQETSSSNSGTCLGDYVFFEATCPTDTFATALNIKNRQPYLWKKFERRDYMKKLEPYFVMEGTCDKIYRFADIMVKANYQQQQAATSSGSELLTDATVEDQDDSVYVVFEPHYGDLHSFMKEKKRLDEAEARAIFGQCVEAVQACHENGIIIRDIKLKKFVFLDPERTKIGLANLEDCLLLDEDAENDLIKNQQGCPAYVSPEVLNPFQTSYSGKLSDAWSLGIILYTLLVGRYPFHHPTIANMFARIARGKFQVPMPISLSLDARTLLRSLIRVKPEERLRPDEILAHNWFRQNETDWSSASSLRMTLTATVNSNKSHQHALVFSQPNQWSAVNPLVINKIGLSSSPLSSSSNDTHTATKDSSVDHSGRDDCCVPQLPE